MSNDEKRRDSVFRRSLSRRGFLYTALATVVAAKGFEGVALACDELTTSTTQKNSGATPGNRDNDERVAMNESIIERVALRVRDLDRAVRFYEDVVGLRRLDESDSSVQLGIPESSNKPLLVLHESPEAPKRRADEAGLFHIAFRVPNEEALADALRRIRDQGARLTGASNHEISHALYLDDPEGNGLEIYCDQPREQWPMDEQGRLQLSTRPLDLEALRQRQPTKSPERFPPGTDVGHIHLEGTDIGDARRFYAQLLGLNVTVETSSVLFTAEGDYHHHVGVNHWRGRRRPKSKESLGLVAVTARVPLDRKSLVERIEEAGFLAQSGDEGIELQDRDNIRWRLHST